MNLYQLEIFTIIYEKQSISEAALFLQLEPSSLSRTLKTLEKELNRALFNRYHHSIVPTEDGDTLYFSGKTILEMVEKTQKQITNHKLVVKIGCTSTIGTFILPPIIREITPQFSEININLVVDSQENISRLVSLGLIDFALIEDGIVYQKELKYQVVGGDCLIPIMSSYSNQRNANYSLAEFAKFPIITREQGSSGRKHLETLFFQHKSMLSPVAECSSTLSIIELVRNDFGVSLIPESYAKQYINQGFLSTCRIIDDKMSRNFYFVTNPLKVIDNHTKAIIDILLTKLRDP